MNYTPLPASLLGSKEVVLPSSGGKEAEPLRVSVAETRAQQVPEVEPVEKPETEQYLEQVSDDIPLSDDLKQLGAAPSPAQGTLIIDGRMIRLPIALEEVDDGLRRPLTSGKRWMAIMVSYLLDKLHVVIRRVGGKIGVVRSR